MASTHIRYLLSICFAILFATQCIAVRTTCPADTRCISILECPKMLDLVQSGNSANLRIVRNSICGFEGRRSKVCCDFAGSSPVTMNPFVLPVVRNVTTVAKLPEECGKPSFDDRIIGGHPAPIGAYPWMAAFGYTEPGVRGFSFVCSGSVISSRYILTAAHCVAEGDLGRKRLKVIHLGDWDLESDNDCQMTTLRPICSSPHLVVGIEDIIIHPDYNTRGRSSDDIALIRINQTIDFETEAANVQPVCLPPKGFKVHESITDRRPVAAGWGLTENGTTSRIMLRVDLPIADEAVCRQRYQSDYVGKQLCIGGDGKSDTCSADSGGPLVVSELEGPPFTQIGIVSFGAFPCAFQGFPGVYTSVADYKDWILSQLKP